MARRTFGWVQNPGSIETLKKVAGIFVKDSEICRDLTERRIPEIIEYGLAENPNVMRGFLDYFQDENIKISYEALKGKGAGADGRKNAKCSGIVQAVITAQKSIAVTDRYGVRKVIKKPYTDDWTADGYLRWAISIGLLKYDEQSDCCMVSDLGRCFVSAEGEEEKKIIGEAFLTYPPVVRILKLLDMCGHQTKFELGSRLGFVGEAGFTSIAQNMWAAAFCEETDGQKKTKIVSNEEGSSDKYARMICGWLASIGWVKRQPKTVTEVYGGTTYTCTIGQAFVITMEGRNSLRKAFGMSSTKRIPRIVFLEMLATKTFDKQYVRLRRAHMINFISVKDRSPEEIQKELEAKGFKETIGCIQDDLEGLKGIGLDIAESRGRYKLKDKIENLIIPAAPPESKTEVTEIKDRVREKLQHVPHKYLNLIDLAFDGQMDREFELQTIDLLTNELAYEGRRLGDSRKPDGIVYYGENGLIIENKAYSKGYQLPRAQADEMVRYLQENNERNPMRNANEWWKAFDAQVKHFNFVFISSMFKGKYKERLDEIFLSTGVKGAVLSAENLLYMAEKIKSHELGYEESFGLFEGNDEVEF